MEKTERQKMADISMSELIELEKEATASLDGIELNNKTMQRPQGNNPMLNVDASVKVVVSDNHLEANMCVFSPQFSGKDITVEAMRQALKDEHVVYGIDEELLEEIAANKLYDKIFTVASGYAAVDGENGRVNNLFDTDKKLVPRKLEDGSVDYRDLGLIVNVRVNDLICEIVPETQGEEGMNVYGQVIAPRPGRPPLVPQGSNTVLSADGRKVQCCNHVPDFIRHRCKDGQYKLPGRCCHQGQCAGGIFGNGRKNHNRIGNGDRCYTYRTGRYNRQERSFCKHHTVAVRQYQYCFRRKRYHNHKRKPYQHVACRMSDKDRGRP